MNDPVRPCPACDVAAPASTWQVPGKRDITGAPLGLARCGACGLVYQPRHFTQEQLARWYEYMGHNANNFADTPLLTLRLARQLAPLERYRRTGKLLDVGCGGGVLLRAAERSGWIAHGTEISASCIAALRPTYGDRLHHGELASAPFGTETFDVITLSEVIEHVPAPALLLADVWPLLRPGGALFLTTPNRRGVAGTVLGDRWRVVGDEHLTYFTRDTLRRTLERSGFIVDALWTSGLDLHALRDVLPRGGSAPAAPVAAAAASPPPMRAAASSASRTALWRAVGTSAAADLINLFARVTRLGDGLRAIARRPGPHD